MAKGYIRIVEAIMMISILFYLLLFMIGNRPPSFANPSNIGILDRYGKDLTNMVCNSEEARKHILLGNARKVYNDLVYVTPNNFGIRMVVDSNAIGEDPGKSDLVSYGCIISSDTGEKKKVIIQVWNK